MEMQQLLTEWVDLDKQVEQVYTFFNNCHRGQAAENAEAFKRLVEQL